MRVHNTLDSKLDWNTFQLETDSHMSYIEILDGNQIDFIFNNIQLADSLNNEAESHGFIAYKIKPKQNINVGDVIRNKAEIYFDFNQAVITNTVSTQVVIPSSTQSIDQTFFSAYPIPSSHRVQISSVRPIAVVLLYSTDGSLVKTISKNDVIDISDLLLGVYFAHITDVDGVNGVVKILKN